MLFEIRGQIYQNSKLFSLSFHYKIIVGILDGVRYLLNCCLVSLESARIIREWEKGQTNIIYHR